MPPQQEPPQQRSLEQMIEAVGLYPVEAYQFVQEGLSWTVQSLHGPVGDPNANRHVSGQQLCFGLRDFALQQWGLMARTVLSHWNIKRTSDFGRIVFALIDINQMQKTDQDTTEDFEDVFDFRTAFEAGYRIPAAV